MEPAGRPVLLARPNPDDWANREQLALLATRARTAAGDAASAVRLVRDLPPAPVPGRGRTRELWELLATLGAADLTVARVAEPHLDALAILDQAQECASAEPGSLWGVYAAEGPEPRVTAAPAAPGWRLSGRKHWCSLADRVDRALVTAWVGSDQRGLFAVPMRAPGVRPSGQSWVARGLPTVTSTAVDLDDVPATAVGEPGWYLSRPGFAWGGMGVAAVWYGGAVGLARRLDEQARTREPDQIALMHRGAVDAVLHAARCVLADAAAQVDSGLATGEDGAGLALRVRQVVRRAAEEVLHRTEHALGPAPLALEEEHAARVADLQLYLRQEHAERDQAALGRRAAADPAW